VIDPHKSVLIRAYPEPSLPVQVKSADSARRRIITAAKALDHRSPEASYFGLASSKSQKPQPKLA
jgi:hypothetical protein